MPGNIELANPIDGHKTLNYQDTVSWGARYGYRVDPVWGGAVSWTYVNMDAAGSDKNVVDCPTCSFKANFFDFDGEWYPGGRDWSVYGGLGWLTTNFEISIRGESNDRSFTDDTFTWNVGTAYTWRIGGGGFYLRPDFRFRWLQLD